MPCGYLRGKLRTLDISHRKARLIFMEKRIAVCLFVLLTAGIVFCAAWIAWMLAHYMPRMQAFTNAYLVQEVLRHAAV